jgi:hypothetical protein
LLASFFLWAFGLAAAAGVAGVLLIGLALAMAYPQLPDVSDLSDYRPKLSMRIYSVEGKQIGEFGEERRNLTPFKDIPQVMKDAVLSIEDSRFYQHGGVDYIGLLRASIANLVRLLSLDREIQGYLGKGQLSTGHAKVLLGLENQAHRVQVARLVIEKGLSVRALEAEVKKLAATKKGDRKRTEKSIVEDVQKRLASHLSARVQVVQKGKKGSITIAYEGDDDLARLLEKLGVKT